MTILIEGLVSTVIPVYNRAGMLAEAVRSVIEQSYRPVEVIVVDDGSIDETGGAADALAAEYPEEVRVIHQPNGGVGRAREAGRLMVRGEFIQYLDSDDLLLPRKFELQVAALRRRPDCGVAYGKTRGVARDGSATKAALRRTGEKIETMFPSLLESRWWATSTPLYRRGVADAAGPWTELQNEEDWEYDCRIASQGVSLAFVDEFVSEHRDHNGDRLSRRARLDPVKLRYRSAAHQLIFAHAARANVPAESREMRHFVRELFLLSRECGAAGLKGDSRKLFDLAKVASARAKEGKVRLQLGVYKLAATLAGWSTVGKLACYLDRSRA